MQKTSPCIAAETSNTLFAAHPSALPPHSPKRQGGKPFWHQIWDGLPESYSVGCAVWKRCDVSTSNGMRVCCRSGCCSTARKARADSWARTKSSSPTRSLFCALSSCTLRLSLLAVHSANTGSVEMSGVHSARVCGVRMCTHGIAPNRHVYCVSNSASRQSAHHVNQCIMSASASALCNKPACSHALREAGLLMHGRTNTLVETASFHILYTGHMVLHVGHNRCAAQVQ